MYKTNRQIFDFIIAARVKAEASTPYFQNYDYENYTFEFVEQGEGFVEHNGEKFHCKSNSLYILQSKSNHKYYHHPDNPWEKVFFNIKGKLMDELMSFYNLKSFVYIENVPHLHQYFLSILSLAPNNYGLANLIVHELLHDLHTTINRETEKYPPIIYDLKTQLDIGIKGTFNLEGFSKKNGVSKTYLINEFKKHFQFTPYDYLINNKIITAKHLLTHTNFSIKEISGLLYFCNQYYFAKLFKNKTNLTPSEYKKSSQKLNH